DLAAAHLHCREALALRRALGDQAGTAISCALAAEVLAALEHPRPAAVAYGGALAAMAKLGCHFDPVEQQTANAARARLDAALAAGEVTADELVQWQAQGAAISLDELAKFTLAALEEARNE